MLADRGRRTTCSVGGGRWDVTYQEGGGGRGQERDVAYYAVFGEAIGLVARGVVHVLRPNMVRCRPHALPRVVDLLLRSFPTRVSRIRLPVRQRSAGPPTAAYSQPGCTITCSQPPLQLILTLLQENGCSLFSVTRCAIRMHVFATGEISRGGTSLRL